MKFFWSVLLAVAFTLPAWAQGQLGFSNHVRGLEGVIVDAPVFDTDCETRLSGSAFLSQFYAGSTQNSLAPSGQIVSFGAGAGAGYVQTTFGRVAAEVADGQIFYVQMRAWPASAGSTYEAAVASGGKYGFSNIVPEAVRVPPGPPEVPVGLQSFCLIPEPAPLAYFALAILMAAALKSVMLRRTG